MWWLFAWETTWWLVGKHDRRVLYAAAEAAAQRRRKPMLVVGEPDAEYPCPTGRGDALVDLRAASRCRNFLRVNVESMPMFAGKQFGAALCSHVLEHCNSPQRALRELHRVADEVFVAYPRPWRLATWLVPGHVWIVTREAGGDVGGGGGFRFTRIRPGPGNVPTRYGT